MGMHVMIVEQPDLGAPDCFQRLYVHIRTEKRLVFGGWGWQQKHATSGLYDQLTRPFKDEDLALDDAKQKLGGWWEQ